MGGGQNTVLGTYRCWNYVCTLVVKRPLGSSFDIQHLTHTPQAARGYLHIDVRHSFFVVIMLSIYSSRGK